MWPETGEETGPVCRAVCGSVCGLVCGPVGREVCGPVRRGVCEGVWDGFCPEVIGIAIVPVIGPVTRGVGESETAFCGLRAEIEWVTGISCLQRSCPFCILWVEI